MQNSPNQKTPETTPLAPDSTKTLRLPKSRFRRMLPWLIGYAALLAAAVCLAYYWRVVYLLAELPLIPFALGIAGVFTVFYAAAFFLWRRFQTNIPFLAAACVFALGLVFCFVTEPFQVPDEVDRFLRAYSLSEGHLNYDHARGYPADVNYLCENFPQTHNFQVLYAGAELAPKSFARYFEQVESGVPMDVQREPVTRQTVAFIPQAIFMAVARLFGVGALGCLYAARMANLLCYAVICYFAFKFSGRWRGVFIAVAMLPLSLYLAASCSCDAVMLACCYLCAAYLGKEAFTSLDVVVFSLALCYASVIKPVNIFLLVLLFLIPRERWRPNLKPAVVAGGLAAAAVLIYFVSGELNAMLAVNFPAVLERNAGGGSSPSGQMAFVLGHIPRFLSTMILSFVEEGAYLLELGTLGSTDMPIPLAGALSAALLFVAAALGIQQRGETSKKQAVGLLATIVLYTAAVLAGLYVLATNVSAIRVTGIQPRYFLPVFLLIAMLLSVLFGKAARPALQGGPLATRARTDKIVLAAAVAVTVITLLLLFQNTFIGQWIQKGDGGHKMVNLFGWQVL